jgi:hypothetical protein
VKPSPLVSVYRDGNTWRWTCRLPLCCQSDWRGRHRDALTDAQGHLNGHARFGLQRR